MEQTRNLFCCLFPKPTLSGELALAAPYPKGCTVMDYPITRISIAHAVQVHFKLQDGDGDYTDGPRVLVVVKGKKRKSRTVIAVLAELATAQCVYFFKHKNCLHKLCANTA